MKIYMARTLELALGCFYNSCLFDAALGLTAVLWIFLAAVFCCCFFCRCSFWTFFALCIAFLWFCHIKNLIHFSRFQRVGAFQQIRHRFLIHLGLQFFSGYCGGFFGNRICFSKSSLFCLVLFHLQSRKTTTSIFHTTAVTVIEITDRYLIAVWSLP